MKALFLITVMSILMLSCTPSPKPIDYGNDMCHFCKMTIVDKQHAAEVVTSKGKVFLFDAIECMVPHVIKNEGIDYSFILVNDYSNPGQLIDAREASFLISEGVPSPMGGFLTAFLENQAAQNVMNDKGGKLYNWNDIYSRFNARLSKL